MNAENPKCTCFIEGDDELCPKHQPENYAALVASSAGDGSLDPLDGTLSECPRSKWYSAAGKRLRAEGWRLRQTGPRWNAQSALIEKRPIVPISHGNK